MMDLVGSARRRALPGERHSPRIHVFQFAEAATNPLRAKRRRGFIG